MGHKTHPIGFRLGVIKDWQTKWFASKASEYRALVLEDMAVRDTILGRYRDAGISGVDIERGSSDVVITIHTARPGIVIGRGGQRVEELRKVLEGLTERRARLNVQEIRQPELDAYLVARSVADQLERRIAFRRVIRQSASRTMQAGAQGIKIVCAGRLGGAEIARREKHMEGRVPLHTLRADIDYGTAEAHTDYGRIGVKVWIFKGEILPVRKQEEEEIQPIEVTLRVDQLDEEVPAESAEAEAVAEAPQPVVETAAAAQPESAEAAAVAEAPQPVVETAAAAQSEPAEAEAVAEAPQPVEETAAAAQPEPAEVEEVAEAPPSAAATEASVKPTARRRRTRGAVQEDTEKEGKPAAPAKRRRRSRSAPEDTQEKAE